MVVWPDGSECLLPAVVDFYWRRDMSSGVIWPRSASDACEVKRWQGWSDGKGNSAALNAARGAVSVNALMDAVSRPVDDVLRALEAQLLQTFLGESRVRQLMVVEKAKIVVHARVLEADGTALRVKTLWTKKLRIARS